MTDAAGRRTADWPPTAELPAGAGRRLPARRQAGMSRTGRLTTLPERMHDVQTLSRLGDPSTRARTRWMFGFQRRLVRRWEWLMFMPNDGFLPQTSHTAAMTL